jgi:hypothetical protein
MDGAELYDKPHETEASLPTKGHLLAITSGFIIAGSLPFFSFYFRGFTWMVWGLLLTLIGTYSFQLPMGRLLRPFGPYLLWLVLYLVWGLIIADAPSLPFASRTLATTLLLGLTLAILANDSLGLRALANATQFAVTANVLFLVLFPFLPSLEKVYLAVTQQSSVLAMGIGRYGGLWGSPNMGGYVCLVALVLSAYATPWIAWTGRLATLPIIYMTASRRAGIFLVVLILLYMLIVQLRNVRFWLGSIALIAVFAVTFSLSTGLRNEAQSAGRSAALNRMMDVEEKDTAAKGGITRMALLNEWSDVLAKEPWYGYGLRAMSGTQYDEETNRVINKGLLPLGTHNTYLGIWIEIGPAGLLAFLLVMAYYTKLCLTFKGASMGRWAMISLAVVNLAYLLSSHTHLFCFEGQFGFAMMFLLPVCGGARDFGRT